MKTIFFALFLFIFLIASQPGFAQYYYKDIVSNKETAGLMKAYLANKVTAVQLVSYDGEGTKSDAISVSQTFSVTDKVLRTQTRSESGTVAVILSFINDKGQVIKTVDSSELSNSITTYQYNASGQLQNITSLSTDSTNAVSNKEEHQWEYKDGKITRLLRIKNGTDTAFVQFKLDEAGNVTEERLLRKGIAAEPIYYYYDAQNRLTDIVRFNNRVKRLLPEMMFEYSANNQVIQRISVPAVGSKYLIWRYQYDERGLKIKEAVYDKYKQLNGKVEYRYSFGY